jgi:hypothetical protein
MAGSCFCGGDTGGNYANILGTLFSWERAAELADVLAIAMDEENEDVEVRELRNMFVVESSGSNIRDIVRFNVR